MDKGIVFDIQKFSVHDGPGIRTTVFFKGCTLKCFWCHNPESISSKPQLMMFPQKCISCGRCADVCQNGAVLFDGGSKRLWNQDACMTCGACAKVCYAGAVKMSGREMTVSEVMGEIRQDLLFYETSGGGVTFSGGEPLLQSGFLRELLRECRDDHIHTAVETAGNVPWEAYESVLPYVDLFLQDLKVMDSLVHRRATGAGNERCLDNIRKLAFAGANIIIRVPVICGINDTEETMIQILDFVRTLDRPVKVQLLPFHNMGSGKYAALGQVYQAEGFLVPKEESMERLQALFT